MRLVDSGIIIGVPHGCLSKFEFIAEFGQPVNTRRVDVFIRGFGIALRTHELHASNKKIEAASQPSTDLIEESLCRRVVGCNQYFGSAKPKPAHHTCVF